MISRYAVTLNGIALSELSADILILDVGYAQPSYNDRSYSVAKRHGSRLIDRKFNSAGVTVTFEIHAYDIRQRQAICNAVCAWAKNGGVLETNDREGQYLQCVCTGFPSVESARNWTDPLTIEFSAYAIPFWQEKLPQTVALTGTSQSGTLYVPGNVDDALVEATIKANASVSSVALTVNGRTLTLSGLSLSTNGTITITYDTEGIQSIKQGSTSILDKRTGVDDLLAKCGEINDVSITASASVTVTFSVRGYWL